MTHLILHVEPMLRVGILGRQQHRVEPLDLQVQFLDQLFVAVGQTNLRSDENKDDGGGNDETK
jgi:hypothetical protein